MFKARFPGPALRIGGLSLLSRASDGSLVIAGYHPRREKTWSWSVSLGKRNGNRPVSRAAMRSGQWHDHYNIGAYGLCISRQDFHKQLAA